MNQGYGLVRAGQASTELGGSLQRPLQLCRVDHRRRQPLGEQIIGRRIDIPMTALGLLAQQRVGPCSNVNCPIGGGHENSLDTDAAVAYLCIASAASRVQDERLSDVPVEQWTYYVASVNAAEWWPSHRCTWTTLRSCANSIDAHVCRKAWNPTHGRHASSRAGWGTRRKTLLGMSGEPLAAANTDRLRGCHRSGVR